MIKCSRCGKEVSSRPGSICPKCGFKVSEEALKIRCHEPSCRSLVSKKYDYCPNCGCKLKGYKIGEIFDMVRYKIDETLDKK
jgi:rRNA maturation endonuclease Nob1